MSTETSNNAIVQFDGTPGQAANINYSVPLPASHIGKRMILMNLGIKESEWRKKDTPPLKTMLEQAGASGVGLGERPKVEKVDEPTAFTFWKKRARMANVSPETCEIARNYVLKKRQYYRASGDSTDFRKLGWYPDNALPWSPEVKEPEISFEHEKIAHEYILFLDRLVNGRLIIPTLTPSGGLTSIPYEVVDVEPQLFLIEVYGISSFLGDYGLGKTVKTFTLLPGESTTITMKTWKSSEESIAQGSSIVDSNHESATQKFTSRLATETTDKSTVSETKKWSFEASARAEASLGVGIEIFDVGASGGSSIGSSSSGECHASREEFAKRANDVTREHAEEASSSRELSITASAEKSVASGDETNIERTLSNVNMRRTLNFVFRELNQEYITKLHLKDIRIAYTDGTLGSWKEVPVSGLLGLLLEVIDPNPVTSSGVGAPAAATPPLAHGGVRLPPSIPSRIPAGIASYHITGAIPPRVNHFAQRILDKVGIVFDHQDTPVNVLELLTMNDNGDDWESIEDAKKINGQYPPPNNKQFYRFKRHIRRKDEQEEFAGHDSVGALGQDGQKNPVPGVLLKQSTIVMRTDSVIVEALLGQSDALDAYAMEVQQAASGAKTLQNEREKLALETLLQIQNPEDRAKAFAAMFNPTKSKGEHRPNE